MKLFRNILALLLLPVAVAWAVPMPKLALPSGPVEPCLGPGCLKPDERGKIVSIEAESGLPVLFVPEGCR